MAKILISVIMITLTIGCGEKDVVTTEHVWGNVYVNKRMPKSEYDAMVKKRDSLDRESFKQEQRRKNNEREWAKREFVMNEIDVKSEAESQLYSPPMYYNEPINTEKFEKLNMISVNYEIGFWLFMLLFFNLMLLTVLTVSSKPDDS